MTVTGISALGGFSCTSEGESGLFADFCNTLILPLVSRIAYSTSDGLKHPAPRNASIMSSMLRFNSFMTSGIILPFCMMIIGLPLRNLRNLMLFVASFVMMICTKNSEKTGIIPYKMGIDESAIGMHTRSLATSVIASSKGCNSPSCRLPISRMAMSKTKYKIKHLINKFSIRIVCIQGVFFMPILRIWAFLLLSIFANHTYAPLRAYGAYS